MRIRIIRGCGELPLERFRGHLVATLLEEEQRLLHVVSHDLPHLDLSFPSAFDPARRLELSREIQRKLAADQPVTPLYNPQSLVLVSTQLRNVKVRRLGARWFDWWQAP